MSDVAYNIWNISYLTEILLINKGLEVRVTMCFSTSDNVVIHVSVSSLAMYCQLLKDKTVLSKFNTLRVLISVDKSYNTICFGWN